MLVTVAPLVVVFTPGPPVCGVNAAGAVLLVGATVLGVGIRLGGVLGAVDGTAAAIMTVPLAVVTDAVKAAFMPLHLT
jgi:hypothetical protein